MASANNAKKGANVRMKRKERKNIAAGQAHIQSTFNNTVVTIPKGTTRVELRILRGGVTAGSVSGNLKIQLELGNTAHEWMKPDVTSLEGGGAMS